MPREFKPFLALFVVPWGSVRGTVVHLEWTNRNFWLPFFLNYTLFSRIDLYVRRSSFIMKSMTLPFPVVIAREGKWFVASCPVLGVATQGRSKGEVKEMIADLIADYLNDPDTQKPTLAGLKSVSLTSIPVEVPKGVLLN